MPVTSDEAGEEHGGAGGDDDLLGGDQASIICEAHVEEVLVFSELS